MSIQILKNKSFWLNSLCDLYILCKEKKKTHRVVDGSKTFDLFIKCFYIYKIENKNFEQILTFSILSFIYNLNICVYLLETLEIKKIYIKFGCLKIHKTATPIVALPFISTKTCLLYIVQLRPIHQNSLIYILSFKNLIKKKSKLIFQKFSWWLLYSDKASLALKVVTNLAFKSQLENKWHQAMLTFLIGYFENLRNISYHIWWYLKIFQRNNCTVKQR